MASSLHCSPFPSLEHFLEVTSPVPHKRRTWVQWGLWKALLGHTAGTLGQQLGLLLSA